MNPLRFAKIKAEDVAAIWWESSSQNERQRACQVAGISDVHALLGWHDLQLMERVPLTILVKSQIEAIASRLRREARPANQLSA